MDLVIHQLCNAFVEHSVYQVRCLVPLPVFVLSYGPKHEGFLHERESERERERERERGGGGGGGQHLVCIQRWYGLATSTTFVNRVEVYCSVLKGRR